MNRVLQLIRHLFATFAYNAAPPEQVKPGLTPARITVLSSGRSRSRRDRRRRSTP